MATAPKVALFGLFGSGNLGNGGSLDAMLRFLRTTHPTAELACVCAGPEEVEREFGIPAFSITWYRPIDDEPRARAVLRKAVGKVVDAFRTLRWVRRFDVVVVPGTGVLEATLPIRPWGFPYALLLVSAWGRLCGTKVALVSVGADSTTQPVTRWVMKSAARLANYRSYRDELSRDAMRTMGVDTSDDAVYPDLAFGLPVPPTGNSDTKVVGVGVMAYHGTHVDRRQAEDIYATYVDKITAFVEWLVDEGYGVRLFTGDPSDEAVAAAVTSTIRRSRPGLADTRIVTDFAPSYGELVEQMSSVDLVVASRFHNVLSALKLAKPTISISYASKNDRLMEGMGLGRFCQPIRSLDVPRLIEQFRTLADSGERLRGEMLAENERKLKLLGRQNAVLSATLFATDGSSRIPAAARSD
ncbi:MAG TPA: polysaccharide pyruvyl transferase family protein [Kribbella sp.]|nr:polysaccharide pyruvyl transferase family protein [Kribbella sp.]